MSDTDTDTQDLGISEPRKPDTNWSRSQPIKLTADQARLDQPHSTVMVRNTSTLQTHIIVDRHMQGHELAPGQAKKDIEMLNADVDYYHRRRKFGMPVVVEGTPRVQAEEPRTQQAGGQRK